MSKTTSIPAISLSSGYSIPQIGLGVYLTGSDVASTVVKQGLEVGYRHIDSAAIYGNEAEAAEGILAFLEENPEVKRADVFFTTKIWEADFGYKKTKAAIERSLERVQGLGYVDLLLMHTPRVNPPASATSVEAAAFRRETRLGTWRAFQEAVAAGTVKSIGVSNFGEHHIRELLEWDGLKVKPAVNQIELHPWFQHAALVDYCRAQDIFPEAYSPLTHGQRLTAPLDATLAALAAKHRKSPAQILIRWSTQKQFVTLPKSVHINRLRENFEVWDFELSEEEVDSLGDKYLYGKTVWDPTVDP